MLAVQEYLQTNSLESLTEELAIKAYFHPELPLVGLKYCQINSPRSHPVVRECRGIVLEMDTWEVVAKPFRRFFNVGEFIEDFKQFNWNDFTVVDKADGSLIIAYTYQGKWHFNTSGSFGLGKLGPYGGTWRDLFLEVLPEDASLQGLENYTLMFELCTPYNKVVQLHPRPKVFLLGACEPTPNGGYFDLPEDDLDSLAQMINVPRPNRHVFHQREALETWLLAQSKLDPTYEGVILRDGQSRWKWKTKTYVALHQLKDNGNILSARRLVPMILQGEIHEVIATLPEVTSAAELVKAKLDSLWEEISSLWTDHKDAPTRKEFALAVKDHKLATILFKNIGGDLESLRKTFETSDQQIAKSIFGQIRFEYDLVKTFPDGSIIIERGN